MPDVKICTDCHTKKPLSDFHRNRYTKDGRLNQCKMCRGRKSKVYYKKTKSFRVEYGHKYYYAHREGICSNIKMNRASNKEKYSKFDKEQYLKHMDKKRKRDKKRSNNLTDGYIKMCLRSIGFSNQEINADVIKKKRAQIKRKRALGKYSGKKNLLK